MSDKHAKRPDDEGNPMPAEAFREWRKRLGLKQKDAAELLGLKKRMIQYYETGSRSGKHVSIPKSIRLACYALEVGVGDYDGSTVLKEAPIATGLRRQIVQQPMASPAPYAETAPRHGESLGHRTPSPLPSVKTEPT
jgi:transcriptional regulator with XRE-family HTH domain